MAPCPDPSTLEGLFQGTLARPEQAALERHLDGCEACTATVAELARLFGSTSWSSSSLDTEPAVVPEHRDAPRSEADFGRYRLGRRLGAGGMGMVFEAEDRELHRQVAIKLLFADLGADPEQTRARLMREARAMARTAHPNVVAVYDVGRVSEQVFLAMELVAGSTLTQWLSATPRRRPEILKLFAMAGRGLEAAHGAGLVHRDFKPDNVLVGADGRARVTDFGLALPSLATAATGSTPATDIRTSTQIATERGAIVGTPAYMAPEQWQGLPADARSDQFSFCVALFEALFGARPFVGETLGGLLRAVLDGDRRPTPRNTPRWLRAILERGLSLDPAARFPSMSELLAALERDRSKPWRVVGVLGAMGLGAAGTVAVLTQLSGDALTPTEPDLVTQVDVLSGCQAAARSGRDRWATTRRAALLEHVGAMDDGEVLSAMLFPLLDQWIATWTADAEASCDLETPADRREAERRCFDAALARFDAAVQLAGELPGFQVASALLPAAHQLPASARCRDPAWLELEPEPAPARAQAKATLLVRDLVALEAAVDLEQWLAARERAPGIVEAAEALGHAPLLAKAQLARGRLEAAAGDPDAAIPWLEAAAETATLGGDERVLGLAALALAEHVGAGQLRARDGERWLRIALALAERLDDPSWLGRTLLVKARMLAAAAETREALTVLDQAEPHLREAFAEGHPLQIELALMRADAAFVTADLDAATRAAEHGETLARTALGPSALLTARAQATRAKLALAFGDLDHAEALATAASKIPGVARSRRHDFERGLYLGLLGDIAAARLDHAAALAHYHRAETYLYAAPESALPLIWQGALRLRLGQVQGGLALIDAGWAKLDGVWAEDDLRRLELLRIEGLAALDAGELDRARAALERASSLVDAGLGFGPRQAFTQIDRAQLELAAGHPRAALKLLDSAYVGAVGGIGRQHPRLVAATLTRADLAWDLGDRSYAARLYGVIAGDLARVREPDDPELLRASARRLQPSLP